MCPWQVVRRFTPFQLDALVLWSWVQAYVGSKLRFDHSRKRLVAPAEFPQCWEHEQVTGDGRGHRVTW